MKQFRLYLVVLFTAVFFLTFAGVLPCDADESGDWLILNQFNSAIERYQLIFPDKIIYFTEEVTTTPAPECKYGVMEKVNVSFGLHSESENLDMQLELYYYEPVIPECKGQVSGIAFASRDISIIAKGNHFIDDSLQQEYYIEEKFRKKLLKTLDDWRNNFPEKQ